VYFVVHSFVFLTTHHSQLSSLFFFATFVIFCSKYFSVFFSFFAIFCFSYPSQSVTSVSSVFYQNLKFFSFFADFTFAQNPFTFINFCRKPAKTVHFAKNIFRRFPENRKKERFSAFLAINRPKVKISSLTYIKDLHQFFVMKNSHL